MLHWRLLFGTIIIAALVGLCWLDYHAGVAGMYLLPLALVLAVLAAHEAATLTEAAGMRCQTWLVIAGSVVVVAACGATVFVDAPSPFLPLVGFATCILAALLTEIVRYRGTGGVVSRIATTVFAIAYVGVLLGFIVQLRLIGTSAEGIVALVSLIVIVKLSDIGAYTVGRLLGRRLPAKLAPVLSPGKTWIGVAGGLVFAIGGAWWVFAQLAPAIGAANSQGSPGGWVLYGLLLAAAGIVGDLGESMIKRDAGRKDSSTWLLGFGGVLDLLDSLLVAAPVAFFCWKAGIVGS